MKHVGNKPETDGLAQSASLKTKLDVRAKADASGVVLSTGKTPGAVTRAADTSAAEKVALFSFTDYREYLSAFYQAKHAKNSAYTMSTFIRRAGLGQNSRGYLKMVIEGKRNLTSNTVRRFSDALGLKGKEALYFENLVFFNQAKNAQDKQYYFERLDASAEGKRSEQFELLKARYQYHTCWYYVAIRELVGLSTFQEDTTWITHALRNKITRKQAEDGLSVLLQLGMISRDSQKKLIQSEPLVKYSGGTFSEVHRQFHLEMIERSKEALMSDPYSELSTSGVTLSCDHSRLDEIKKEISVFRDRLNTTYGLGSVHPDAVFQICIQFFQLTPIPAKSQEKKS